MKQNIISEVLQYFSFNIRYFYIVFFW